jgi:hypothetical protein
MIQDPLFLIVVYALLLAGLAAGPWVFWYVYAVTVTYLRKKFFRS